MPGRARERIDDELRRRARHAGALARAHLDKPHFAQMQQRLAHRRSADAEVTHEVALGWQPVSFCKIAVAYHLLEMMCDLVRQFTRLDLPTTQFGIPFIPTRSDGTSAPRSLSIGGWICGRAFFPPVRVLSRLFRRLFLSKFEDAHAAGQLQFFGDHDGLSDRRGFAAFPGATQREELVRPCQAALRRAALRAGLSVALHPRVAISNNRLIALNEAGVTFRYKDCRCNGRERYRTMTLDFGEFCGASCSRAADGLPPHAPLWPPRQRRSQGQHRACSRVLRPRRQFPLSAVVGWTESSSWMLGRSRLDDAAGVIPRMPDHHIAVASRQLQNHRAVLHATQRLGEIVKTRSSCKKFHLSNFHALRLTWSALTGTSATSREIS